MAGEDRAYTGWVREQPCAVQPCGGGVREIHHATNGKPYDPRLPPPDKGTAARRGKGQRPHDYYSIGMCSDHHTGQFHALKGYFRNFTKEQLRSWQEAQVKRLRRAYMAYLARRTPPLPSSAPLIGGSGQPGT